MKINWKKSRRQFAEIQNWKIRKYKGTIEAATGFGKSMIGLLIIRQMKRKLPGATTLIVVPSVFLEDQWNAEIKKAGFSNVAVIVINTLVEQGKQIVCDLLILDEIHRYGAPKFREVFNLVTRRFILGLTATFKRKDGMHQLIESYCPVIGRISLRECLANGWVSDMVVFNLGIELPFREAISYKSLNKSFNYMFAFFRHDFSFALRCVQDYVERAHFAKQFTSETAKTIQGKAMAFIRLRKKRSDFLLENEQKKETVRNILDLFPMKTIVFSETIPLAQNFANHVGDEGLAYHSKSTAKVKKEIAMFAKTSKYRVLSTAKALDEGMNIPDIELAIIHSANSTQRQTIQRIGRTIRFVEGKLSIIINVYIKDTRDESSLKERILGIPNIIWVDSIEEIQEELDARQADFYPENKVFAL